MKIKLKISLALAFLFVAMLAITGISWSYITGLSKDAENILKDNQESIVFMNRIIANCDSLALNQSKSLSVIEANIGLQENNITEQGEVQLTGHLRNSFEKLKAQPDDPNHVAELRSVCLKLQDLNMKAIREKSEATRRYGSNAVNYLMWIAGIVTVVAFTFIINFPGYIADPIVSLTSSIKSIANKDYEERLHFDRKDEFGELAGAFNQMAEKLDEYEHSNLAHLLFEKKRIETIINMISDPVIGLDEQKKVVFVNEQALRLLSLSETQTIGRYAPDIAVDSDLFRSIIRPRLHEEDKPGLLKVTIGGRENYFSKEQININYTPTGEDKSTAIGNVIWLKNVTPYKERDLAKTNFIATISHELKTPIASLQMGMKLLQDDRVGNMNNEQIQILSTLGNEVARLSRITNELLDFSQVETGNIKLSAQPVAPAEIIQYAAEAVRFHAEQKGIVLERDIDRKLPIMLADRDKTTWVLVNLLTNAIRYSPANARVILECHDDSNRIRFVVRDEGPGIESQYIHRIFEKYFQVPGSRGGSGLGLAISKEFIEAQGGEISVQSEPGKGSTFQFELMTAQNS